MYELAILDQAVSAPRPRFLLQRPDRLATQFAARAFCMQQVGEDLRSCWTRLLCSNEKPGALYQSVSYHDYRREIADLDGDVVAVSETAFGTVVGVVPLKVADIVLEFQLSSDTLLRLSPRGLLLLGSEPMLWQDGNAFDSLFLYLLQNYPQAQALSMPSVVVGSFTWRHIMTSSAIRENFYVYLPEGPRNCHSVEVPGSLEAYRASLGKKRRYNLQRQERLLQEHLADELTLVAVDHVGRLHELHGAIEQLRASDPAILTPLEFEAACRHGILLCYVLRAGPRVIGLAIGAKSGNTVLVHRIFHDEDLGRYSPGTTMWQHILRDLIERNEFVRVDMGFGDPAYRHHATNVIEPRARIVLFRRTLANRARIAAHRHFYIITAGIKRRLGDSTMGMLFRQHMLEAGPVRARLVDAASRMRRVAGTTSASARRAVVR